MHLAGVVLGAVDACAEAVASFTGVAVGLYCAYVFHIVVECAHASIFVVYECHMSPSALLIVYSLSAHRFLVAHFHTQAVVGGDAQFDSTVGGALAEEHCVLRPVGKYPHFHCEWFAVPVAYKFGGQFIVFAVEGYRNRVVGLSTVANTCNFEVIVGEQAFGYGFVEIETNFIVHSEYAVGRLCAAEQARIIHILNTAVNCRVVEIFRFVNQTRAHSADIISLVGQVVHKHLVGDCARLLGVNHLGIHVLVESSFIKRRVVVETLQRNPVFIGARSGFVLKHYTVETIVVYVETIDIDFHIVLFKTIYFFGRQFGVVSPVGRRTLQVDIGSRWSEVNMD